MSGGVRNLRAMFENKEESSISPPDRGRSPAGSIGTIFGNNHDLHQELTVNIQAVAAMAHHPDPSRKSERVS
jgi:hypothetical protein